MNVCLVCLKGPEALDIFAVFKNSLISNDSEKIRTVTKISVEFKYVKNSNTWKISAFIVGTKKKTFESCLNTCYPLKDHTYLLSLQLWAAGVFQYEWSFSVHQALDGEQLLGKKLFWRARTVLYKDRGVFRALTNDFGGALKSVNYRVVHTLYTSDRYQEKWR